MSSKLGIYQRIEREGRAVAYKQIRKGKDAYLHRTPDDGTWMVNHIPDMTSNSVYPYVSIKTIKCLKSICTL